MWTTALFVLQQCKWYKVFSEMGEGKGGHFLCNILLEQAFTVISKQPACGPHPHSVLAV